VAVLTDPSDYGTFLTELGERNGTVSPETRLALARKAFAYTSAYDAAVQQYLSGIMPGVPLPERFVAPSRPGTVLRYGENPHQKAAFYLLEGVREPCVAHAETLGGKQLSYNNLLDTDAAFELVREFEDPAAVIIKHTNPCGAAEAGDLIEAFHKAYEGDPLSAFGGIAAFNRPVDAGLADAIADPDRFLEVIVAPDFSPEALGILQGKVRWGKSLRILRTGSVEGRTRDNSFLQFRSINGGVLVQSRDVETAVARLKPVTLKKPGDEALADLRFAWVVVKHVRSNAIVLARGRQLVGVGAGQMSRIDSTPDRLSIDEIGRASCRERV